MSSEIGTLRDTSRRSDIWLTSLIMLRSLVRFQLAPPHLNWTYSVVGTGVDPVA
jgi:hypothetical protein